MSKGALQQSRRVCKQVLYYVLGVALFVLLGLMLEIPYTSTSGISPPQTRHATFPQERAKHILKNHTSLLRLIEVIPPEHIGGSALISAKDPRAHEDIKKRLGEVVYLGNITDFSKYRRKYFIDLGARKYKSSVEFFLQAYLSRHSSSFEVHAFELDKRFWGTFEGKNVTLHKKAAWVRDGTVRVGGSTSMQAVGTAADKAHRKNLGRVSAIDFSSWLRVTVQRDDLCIVKMDIEGGEHELVEKLMADETINLIDELFLECHYDAWSKRRVDKSREQCMKLFDRIRAHGVFAHEWF